MRVVEAHAQPAAGGDIGAVASFTGLVRDLVDPQEANDRRIAALTLEHYPGMTEKKLAEIETMTADQRKKLPDVLNKMQQEFDSPVMV